MTEAAGRRIHDVLDELGIRLDPELVELALTHRSWAYEHGAAPHNERLEFLGDAVLGVVVTEYLYLTYPEYPEGRLAKLRSAVVNTYALADVARSLGIGPLVKLGKGELATGGADKSSILADTTEAVIGAIFLSGGRDAAARFVHHLFDNLVTHADHLGAGLDWKTSLQELCAERGLPAPVYLHEASGPDHDKRFQASASVGGRLFEGTIGRSKKQAEQGAAKNAFLALQADED
ncbi:ribonuclease III [Nigerium sp.]|uniref:ribonuclease III n=1 Tax=Nigerium sp. TaxID=2042655 RepID=UPI0032218A18